MNQNLLSGFFGSHQNQIQANGQLHLRSISLVNSSIVDTSLGCPCLVGISLVILVETMLWLLLTLYSASKVQGLKGYISLVETSLKLIHVLVIVVVLVQVLVLNYF